MAEPRTGWYRRVLGWLRWPLLLAAVAIVIVFLVAQRQSVTTTYGGSGADATVPEGSAGELRGATLPPVDQLQAMVAANRIVRLPGSVASWDQAAVTRAIGTSQVRILVAPPGLKQQQQEQLEADVDNATVVVVGTAVIDVENGLDAVNTVLTDWRDQYGRDDITGLLVTAIDAVQASRAGRPIEASEHGPYATWRDPTATELAPVATALRATGFYAAPGATLRPVPRQDTARAFGTDAALYVALPAQPRDAPAPDYGPALGRLFPGTPIVLMYGDWIEYHGPHATDFAELAGAAFYARYDDRLSRYAYPQGNVLHAYLGLVAGVRFAGLFDRPLPYRPYDPLRVGLPALPWVFAACVAAFLALSVRSVLRPATAHSHRIAGLRRSGAPARLAGLTALAVEVSGLTGASSDPALVRAIGKLGAARDAIHEGLPYRQVSRLLDDAQAELDAVGRAVGVAGYRPDQYLRGRLA